MKRYKDGFLTLLIMSLVPVAILVAFLLLFFIIGTIGSWHASWEWRAIQKEVTAYVLENKESIELNTPGGHQTFVYAYTPTFDGGIEFGYYYSEDNTYNSDTSKENQYRRGYRTDDYGGDPFDWYYTERICDQWFYYEEHDG